MSSDHSLDEDTEEEEESLVHGGQIDTGVEGDEEHELDQEAGVDEDIGDAGAESDHDTVGGGLLGRVNDSWHRDIRASWELSLILEYRPTTEPNNNPSSWTCRR